jgi:hypothetical protein
MPSPRSRVLGDGKSSETIDAGQAGGDDLVLSAWLDFLARDMRDSPQRLVTLAESDVIALKELVEGVEFSLDEEIPDNVTF